MTTTVPHGYETGDQITIIGVATSGYNGTSRNHGHGRDDVHLCQYRCFPQETSLGKGCKQGKSVGTGSAWSEIDMAMWNQCIRGRRAVIRITFMPIRPTQGFQGGTLTRTLTSADFSGFVDYVKDFTTDTDPDDFKVGDGDQRGYGYNYVRLESDDGKAPDRPVITFAGGGCLSGRRTRFSSDEPSRVAPCFSTDRSPACEWRLGEIYNPSTTQLRNGCIRGATRSRRCGRAVHRGVRR